MPNTGDIVAKIRAALRLSIPDLDTSIGTPMRKILDPIGEAIAECYVDEHLINYQYDVDSKTGGDLDDFVQLFGMTRIPAQRAQGVVTFTRGNDSTSQTTAIIIPIGTQVAALTNPPVYAQTTLAVQMDPGQLTADVPVQAIAAGTAGNVAAGLLTQIVTSAGTLTGVINQGALISGAAQESDEALRTRFKTTVFRSLAGTQAMYASTAMEVPQDFSAPAEKAATQVNVIGSVRTWREQVQVVSGKASTSLTGAAYIYPDNVYCGPDIDGGSFLQPGVHFTFTPSNPATRADATAVLSSLNATTMPDGFYDVVFDYVPQASRNDPANTRFGTGPVGNRIDVWHNGQKPQTATQSVVFSRTLTFNATTTSQYYNGYFAQSNPAALTPPVGYVFVPLAYGPVLAIPDYISVGGVTYTEGVDYFIVHRKDCFGYSPNSLFGIAWNPARMPADKATFSITYTYDRLPRDVQNAINAWRLVGTDARAHAGKQMPLRFHLAVVYDRRFDPTAVKTAIDAALSDFLGALGFGAPVQVSDLIQVIHNVAGVDNLRFLSSADDPASYGIAVMSPYSASAQLSLISANGRATDVVFPDDTYPVFHSTRIIAKGANNFRAN